MEQVYHQAQDYYAGMLQDIQSAQSSIDLEAYIYSDDELGQQFNSALIGAAQRGVRVRVMIDGAGSGIWANKQLQPMIDAGVEAHIFRPMPWRFWQWSMAAYQRPGLKKLLYLFNLMNHRNHRKVMIVDKHIVWLGSFNITQEHLPQNQGGEGWRDTGVRLDSVNADELLAAYDAAWSHPGLVKKKLTKQPLPSGQFRLNYTRKLRRLHYKGMLKHIGQASHRVWITNAYFIPSAKFLRGLQHAARRGIDVRVMVPGHSDILFMPWAIAQFYGHLLKSDIRVFEYQAGVLHAKTLVVDHWVSVGSSNLNQRSLLHDLEVDVVLHEQKAVQEVEQQFLHDQLNAREIKLDDIRKFSPIKKILGRSVLLLRYWL